jgi:DNA-binding NtrC family response regulator
VDHFLTRLNRDYDVAIDGVTPEVLELLAAQPWPGNVRELRRVLGRSMVARQAGMLRPEDLRHADGTPLLAGPSDTRVPVVITPPRCEPPRPGPQRTAMWLAQIRGSVSSGTLARASRISEEVARRQLVALARAGHLRREGGGRATRYVLAELTGDGERPRKTPPESPRGPAGRPC